MPFPIRPPAGSGPAARMIRQATAALGRRSDDDGPSARHRDEAAHCCANWTIRCA